MSVNLLTISTEKLLEKFGAGNHKPGSGSAAAFQGMISAKLLVTVISLTNEDKKDRRTIYKSWLPNLLKMESEINDRIFPKLAELFEEDSVQFGKTINSRKERDLVTDPVHHNHLSRQALKELKIAIDIPIIISKLCIELSEIAEYVFDNGFKSARGDSQVAFSGAVSALAGCISIIQLNLLSFGSDEYNFITEITSEIDKLKLIHQKLNAAANDKIEILGKEFRDKATLYKEINYLLTEIRIKKNLSDIDIEANVIRLQRLIWKYRTKIWKKNVPKHPLEILKPSMVLKKTLGYEYAIVDLENVQTENRESNVAGIIDQPNKLVLISDKFNRSTQNFTAAHELGHAILHKQAIMHRDRPQDGATTGKRDNEEFQADRFATYFLMPKKQVEKIFEELFLTSKFVINENSAFNLTKDSPTKLKSSCKNLRGLSRKLASAETYNNEHFKSISELFGVSVETMAIRLEELVLLEY